MGRTSAICDKFNIGGEGIYIYSVTSPSIVNKVSFADSNSIFQPNNYIPLRLPISLTNLGNTCYLCYKYCFKSTQ